MLLYPAGPCDLNPCPPESTCEERFGNHTCLCRPGLFYSEELKTCSLAKTFPSDLRFEAEFKVDMLDKTSKVFRETADEIIDGIRKTFSKPEFHLMGYVGSTVLSLRQGSVIADVQNFFEVASDVSSESVKEALSNVTFNGSNAEIVELRDTCSIGYCEANSTDCSSRNGLTSCTCKAGYIRLPATDRACFACPSGEKAVNSDYCEPCPFGYSGFNCNESYLLAVVIVSTVLGILLLAGLVTVIVMQSLRWKKKGSLSLDELRVFGDMESNKPPRIPRITWANLDFSWQSANLETANSGSTNALVNKNEPVIIQMDRDGNLNVDRNQSRASPVSNGSRGTSNPQFIPDDGRNLQY